MVWRAIEREVKVGRRVKVRVLHLVIGGSYCSTLDRDIGEGGSDESEEEEGSEEEEEEGDPGETYGSDLESEG